eukprot:6487709-Amphidinium_carterae.1
MPLTCRRQSLFVAPPWGRLVLLSIHSTGSANQAHHPATAQWTVVRTHHWLGIVQGLSSEVVMALSRLTPDATTAVRALVDKTMASDQSITACPPEGLAST